ncbi:hypothetical protein KY343_03080 [Candidatus Woesearchaeota archaeon]|nr:hypothetical protein [Candidatus Woesearchaeota archaeon]
MHHKTKSILVIVILVGFMAIVAVLVNNLEGEITGAVIKPQCRCIDNSDCDDNNPCTEDICLYADNCKAAVCINDLKSNCQ